MDETLQAILFLVLIVSFSEAQNNTAGRPEEFHVGLILDLDSLMGKVSRASVSLAMQDFYSVHQNHSTKLVIHTRDSMGSDIQAASAAIELLEKYKVQAIIGPLKSSEVAFISKHGNVTQVPIISFTATNPSLTTDSMPYFVRATMSDSVQVNSIASLIKGYGWREAILIYDDNDHGKGILPQLIDALQQIDARIPYHSVIPMSATSENIMQELYKLITMQTRVFIVHMSYTRASLLFVKAKEAGMINEGFVWIITTGIANMIDSLSPSVVESMNGAIGVRFHVPKSQEHNTSFLIKWNKMYQQYNSNELSHNKLNIFGLWAYDTVWALAQAAEKVRVHSNTNRILEANINYTSLGSFTVSMQGRDLLTEIVKNKFRGLSGNFDLTNRQLQVSALQIINVVGGKWRHLGFWTLRNGFSQQLNQNGSKTTAFPPVLDLNPVIWPGESTEIPRGWEIPANNGNKLKIGVHKSAYPEFVRVWKDPVTNATIMSGLSIDIFEEAVKRLPFALSYEYQEYDNGTTSGSYNDFVYQIYLQRYDIAIGDTTIRYDRTRYVDFTIPYTESGVAMIVPVKKNVNNMWIFPKPLSKGLWLGSIMFSIYTGVVIWLLERLNGNGYLHGPFSLKQVGTLIFFSISEEKEKLECFLSRVVLRVWMFVLLLVSSSYTATLASMLTVQQLSPTLTDIHELQKQGGYVGFYRGSYIEGVLQDMGFDRSKIRPYDTPDEFHSALSNGSGNGGVAAIVTEVPYIKLFLAKYCTGYTMVGPIYKSAGFAFALPKRSPLLPEISRAIINITGGDSIIQIEKKWIEKNRCQNEEKMYSSDVITFRNFGGLFLVTGCVTACSLCIAVLMKCYKKYQQKAGIELDDPNQQTHDQQRENGDIRDGDQINEESGGSNEAENPTTLVSVPHSPNANVYLLQDCTQDNMEVYIYYKRGHEVHHHEGTNLVAD